MDVKMSLGGSTGTFIEEPPLKPFKNENLQRCVRVNK